MCPLCANPIVVRVGSIEKHLKDRRATFTRDPDHVQPAQWCEASNKRWDSFAKA